MVAMTHDDTTIRKGAVREVTMWTAHMERVEVANESGEQGGRIARATVYEQAPERSRLRAAYAMWAIGLAGYIFAVMCRSSFSAIGADAAIHLQASSSVLSLFIYLQLIVYALMQIPSGMLLDRFGARRMICVGCLFLSVGQGALAVASSVPIAVVGRAIVGLGDSLIFVPVIKLAASWFPVRRLPLINQLTGQIGGIGQIISVYPFAVFMHMAGWRAAFLSVAGTGVLIAVCMALGLRDEPWWTSGAGCESGRVLSNEHRENLRHPNDQSEALPAVSPADSCAVPSAAQFADHPNRSSIIASFAMLARHVRSALHSSGTWCGFWVHSCTWFSANMLYLLWGVPFLTTMEHISATTAQAYLMFAMVMNVVWAITLGRFTSVHGKWGRAGVILLSVFAQMVVWAVMLSTSAPHSPVWIVGFFVVLATGAPCANMAMDYAREGNDSADLGSATGFANTAGFLFSAIGLCLVGIVLDACGATMPQLYTPRAMRCAMLTQYPLWIIGLIGFCVTLPSTLRRERNQHL